MSILPQWLTNIWNPNADAGAAADAQLRAMNSVDYAPGGKIYEKIAAERGTAAADAAQAQVTANYDTQAPIGETAQNAAIDQAFTDSLDASASNLIGSPLAVLWAEIKALIKSVPWWVWIIGIVAVFFWLGGAAIIRAAVKRKAQS